MIRSVRLALCAVCMAVPSTLLAQATVCPARVEAGSVSGITNEVKGLPAGATETRTMRVRSDAPNAAADGPGQLTFIMAQSANEWAAQWVREVTGGGGARPVRLTCLNGDGSAQAVFLLDDVVPTSLNMGAMDGRDNQVAIVRLTIKYRRLRRQ